MSNSTLKETLAAAIKDAMRAKATARLSTLRFLSAAVKQKEVDERRELGDAEITAIVEKQVKQRRESIAAFEQAGRTRNRRTGKGRTGRVAGIPAAGRHAGGNRCRHRRGHRRGEQTGVTGPAAMGKIAWPS